MNTNSALNGIENVMVFEMFRQQGSGLPLPIVTVQTTDAKDIFLLSWKFPYKPDSCFKQSSHVVSIVGERFSDEVNSNMRYRI